MAGWTPGHTTRPNPSPARDCGGEQTFHKVSGCGIFTHRNSLIIFNKNNIFRYFLINIHVTRPSIIYYIIEALTISHLRMSYSWLTLYFLTFYTRFLNSTSCRYEDRPRLASVTERPIIPHPRTSDIFKDILIISTPSQIGRFVPAATAGHRSIHLWVTGIRRRPTAVKSNSDLRTRGGAKFAPGSCHACLNKKTVTASQPNWQGHLLFEVYFLKAAKRPVYEFQWPTATRPGVCLNREVYSFTPAVTIFALRYRGLVWRNKINHYNHW